MSIHNAQGRIGLAAAIAVAALISTPAAQAQSAAQRVAKDPVTGALRAPTADETKALDAKAAAKSRLTGARGLRTGTLNPQPIQHADGSVEQELTEDTQIFSVARRNDDGTLDTACVTGKTAADAAVLDKKAFKAAKAQEHSHEVK
ncbi:hypothetical protein SNE35_03200 [Paucibacter sp. R3-3]|uniref:Uncharacterized protein n=1 Tax=Roseateles agri TaxID=3098619 RepID=A0ABU5DCI2_9BURK|nr:hypothetical protein [Paucibacter sp. R3-3]MDY0743491.1 hypothetical protein [Paucibacter sp. R3-3]